MATALSTLRTQTYTLLNEPSTSNIYSNSLVDLELNNTQVEICDGQHLKFLRATTTFLAPVKTTLTTAITTASTILVVSDTTNWDSAGSVWIDGDIITYTGKTSTTLTGVTGVTVAHNAGVFVYPLKSLPSDYWKTPDLQIQRTSGLVLQPLTYYDAREWYNRLSNYSYTMIFDSGSQFLLIEGVSTTDVLVFDYEKYPTYMTSDADTATIPDPYANFILPVIAASNCMLKYGDDLEGLGTKLAAKGQIQLFKMYKHYGNAEDAMRKIIKCDYKSVNPRSFRGNTRNNFY